MVIIIAVSESRFYWQLTFI